MKTVKIIFASLRRLFDWLAVIANVSASLMILAVMILITFDIAFRYLINSPIRGVNQIAEIAIVVIVYMQLAHTLKMGRMTRSDALYSSIMKRRPAIGNAMGILFNAAGAVLMIAIIIGGWPKWIEAYKQDHFIGSVGVFTFPEWPQLLVILIGCAMMAIQFALLVFDHIDGLLQMRPVEDGASSELVLPEAEEHRK